MSEHDESLADKTIVELLGEHFFIPHYQRGYRWNEQQVEDLLKDIWFFSKSDAQEGEFYCLQPVVVKRKQWTDDQIEFVGWEVIDGQQRLTTLFVLIKYLMEDYLKVDSLVSDYGKDIFSIYYETRPRSAAFLRSITEDNSNADFHYISRAKNTIRTWFTSGAYLKDRTDRETFLGTLLGKRTDKRSVRVIWYRPKVENAAKDDLKESIKLFDRLNMGKIPLTNAELIKALFLSASCFADEPPEVAQAKKIEIAHLWDAMEQQLGDESFWTFITNRKGTEYPTRIELIFDLIAGKRVKELDPLFTFLHFLRSSAKHSLWDLWVQIEQYYQTLCEWRRDKNLYHKIGYLVAVGADLGRIITSSITKTKVVFEQDLLSQIRERMPSIPDLDELDYESAADRETIEHVLLLFNVESIRQNMHVSEFYPFQFHKGTAWTLEHIHAQNSDALDRTKRDQWRFWLRDHETLIRSLVTSNAETEDGAKWNELLISLSTLDIDRMRWEDFVKISERIIAAFTQHADDQIYSMHSLSNLALLGQPENSALNNSVFELKRRTIIEMDKDGSYIPICTRRVFLKYYSDVLSSRQVYFWGPEDRRRYMSEIKSVLAPYLRKESN